MMMRLLLSFAAQSMLFVDPGTMLAIHFELPLFRFFKFPFLLYIPVVSAVLTGSLVALTTEFMILLYTSALYVSFGMASKEFSTELSPTHKWKRLYRRDQVHHAMFTYMIRGTMPYLLLASAFLVIAPIFALIRLHSQFNILILGAMSSVAAFVIVVIKTKIEFSVRVTQQTRKLLETFKQAVYSTTMEDKAFFRSLRPLKFYIGHFVPIQPLTYLIIMHNIICNGLIN